MACKLCYKKVPKRLKMEGTRYIYYNEDGNWLGRICPKCVPIYFKARRGLKKFQDRDCVVCKKQYKPWRKDQTLCGPKCRSARKKVNNISF